MFKICRHQLRMALASPRFYIALFMGCAIHIVGILPLFEFSKSIGKPLGMMEGFIYFSSERYTIAAIFLSIVFLVSDIPFSSENETYTLLRVSRRKWLAGKVLYLLCACTLYYFVILLAGIIFLAGSSYVGNFWSEPFYYLTLNIDTGSSSAYFPYPHVLRLSPLQTVILNMVLNILYGFTMSLFLFFCNLKMPRSLGYAAAMLLHAIFYMMLSVFQSKYYTRYSLLGNSILVYHSIGDQYKDFLPSFTQSFLIFGVIIAILILLILWGIRRYDFRITVGAK